MKLEEEEINTEEEQQILKTIDRHNKINKENLYNKLNKNKLKIFINENNEYKNEIDGNTLSIKNIEGDGNCFYRLISYYFHNSENYYNNYRQLIYEICSNDIDHIKEIYVSNNNLLEQDIETYITNISKDGTFAGDIEINKMAQMLQYNIICYTLDNGRYKLQAVYYGNDDKNILIPVNFVNTGYHLKFEAIPIGPKNIGVDIINYN